MSGGVHILNYHHVHDGPDGAFRITPEKFRSQMEALLAQWYVPITLETLLDARRGGPLPAHAILVSFDDGYQDFVLHAWPVLRALHVPATLFVIADAIGGVNDWDDLPGPPHRHLSAEQLRTLVREGCSFGSHSRSHPMLTRVDAARLHEEVAGSRAVLESLLEVPVRAFAYPGGHRDERVKNVVAAHYEMAFATDVPAAGDPYDAPRFDPSFCRNATALLAHLHATPAFTLT